MIGRSLTEALKLLPASKVQIDTGNIMNKKVKPYTRLQSQGNKQKQVVASLMLVARLVVEIVHH